MTQEQKPESTEFRTREDQVSECARDLRSSLVALKEKLYVEFAEAEDRGAAEQRRKDAANDPYDVTCALMDSQYVAGAKFGWNCGQDDDHASLHKMIEGRLRDRIEAGVSFSDRRKEKASAVHEHEQRRNDAEGAEPFAWVSPEDVDSRNTWCNGDGYGFRILEHYSIRTPTATAPLYTGPANVAALEARVKELAKDKRANECAAFERGFQGGRRDRYKQYVRETDALGSRVKELEGALAKLLDWADGQLCAHDNTHRRGSIWTICNDCGRKWADDVKPFDPDEDFEPSAIKQAQAAIREGNDNV